MVHFTLLQPDDFHCHLRDGAHLSRTVTDTAQRFGRAIIMPNLNSPITNATLMQNYRDRIEQYIPKNFSFTPLMTLYLTDQTTPDIIQEAKSKGMIAAKLYPAHVTTNSSQGVNDIVKLFPILEVLQKEQLPLLIHGEVVDPNIDIFDRETTFVKRELPKIIANFPKLRIVLEHISTKDAVQFVEQAPTTVAATITPHHLLLNRNDFLVHGVHPHYYCLPVLKTTQDQQALIQAVISGNPKFFLGTDSAPHAQSKKENSCGCAGIYSAHAAIEFYAEIFEQHHALDRLEGFASIHGAQFYGLPLNKNKMTLVKKSWKIPEHLPFGSDTLIPLYAGKTISWQLHE